MGAEKADAQLLSANEVTSCAACPALACNLCGGLGHLATFNRLRARLRPSEHAIPARRLICSKHDRLDRIPIICQGWAASAVTLFDGRRQILSFLLPGDFVSADLIFEPEIACSVEAITEVQYRTLGRTELMALLLKQPALFSKLSKAWIDEKARVDQLAVNLGRCSADERIARLILDLFERLARRGLAREQVMDFPLRQHHIADATGLTVVHVSKVLSEFRRAGLITINDRSLSILRPTELRHVATLR
jgi:CRP/FNR family transcriptional regulator, anaerobic regulatory protein